MDEKEKPMTKLARAAAALDHEDLERRHQEYLRWKRRKLPNYVAHTERLRDGVDAKESLLVGYHHETLKKRP